MLCGAVGGILNWLSQYFRYQFTFGFDVVLTFRYSFSEASSIKPNKISWTFSNSPTCSTCFSEGHYKTGNTIEEQNSKKNDRAGNWLCNNSVFSFLSSIVFSLNIKYKCVFSLPKLHTNDRYYLSSGTAFFVSMFKVWCYFRC